MNKLNIPKKIHVGFQEREDTYTGKLGYIIYTDQKGVMRKETSWQQWRNEDIEAQHYSNDPIEGFVLNKNGGGNRYSYGWNARNEFVRVYDPRGFEFEISTGNLLFILQECTSTKGKGLEGEFVYGWDGTSLVLIPVSCEEYKKSVEYSALQSKKIIRKDMVEGHTYVNKNTDELLYLGRHTIRDIAALWSKEGEHTCIVNPPSKRMDAFYNVKNEEYVFERGLTKLAKKVNEIAPSNYSTIYTDLIYGSEVAEFNSIELVPLNKESVFNDRYSRFFIVKTGINLYAVYQLTPHMPYIKYKEDNTELQYTTLEQLTNPDTVKNHFCVYSYYRSKYAIEKEYFEQQYNNCELFTLVYKFKTGKTLGVPSFEQQ